MYESYFPRFLEWCQETPGSLLEKSSDINWLDNLLMSWHVELRNRGLAQATANLALATARSFFRWNNVLLPRMSKETKTVRRYESNKIYTREEIARMAAVAKNHRDEAILLAEAHAAQREEVMSALRWGMVSKQILEGQNIVVVSIPAFLPDENDENANKGECDYKFAWGSEVTDLVEIMMQERASLGETIRPDSWLFRGYSSFRSRNPVRMRGDSDPVCLKGTAIGRIISDMAVRAGLQEYSKTPKTSRAVFHCHGFRRYLKHTIRQASKEIGIPIESDLLNYLLGHKLAYGGSYDHFNEDFIRSFYSKLESAISIKKVPTSLPVQAPSHEFDSLSLESVTLGDIAKLVRARQPH